jgi:hypothetical protein
VGHLRSLQSKAQKVMGGNAYEQFSCMYLTRDSGIILGGYSFSNASGNKTQDNKGEADYWIVKLDKKGNIQWDKTIGGSRSDFLTAIRQTKDGGYILGGYSNSDKSYDKSENVRVGSDGDIYPDYWVVKLDSAGNIEWDKTIGGNIYDALTSLQQTSDGGYILGGYSNSEKGYEKSVSAHSPYYDEFYSDYWIVKLDRKGKHLWDKTIGGLWRDYLMCLQQTTDEGYILGGYSQSDSGYEKSQNSHYSNDYWVVKLDKLGNIQWDKTIGGDEEDYLYSIQQTKEGCYVLGGSSYSPLSGEKTQENKGSLDYWVVKVNNLGNIQWDKTIGGGSYDDLASLQQTRDGGYILAGTSKSNISGDKTENNRCECDTFDYADVGDYWMVKLNRNGRIQWEKTIGGDANDVCKTVKEIAANVYVTGGYSSSRISADKKKPSRGEADYWLVTLRYKNLPATEIAASENKDNSTTARTIRIILMYTPTPQKIMCS